MLVYELFPKWLESERLNIRPKTLIGYQTAVNQLMKVIPNKKIDAATEQDCQAAINDLYLTFNYSKSMLKTIRVVLHLSFQYAKKQLHAVFCNPATDIDIPRNASEKLVSALSVNEQKQVEQYCRSDRYGFMILFYL